MPVDRLLKPLPVGRTHYPMRLEGRTVIMAPTLDQGGAGHSSALELRAHDRGSPPVDLDAIALLICRHLDEGAAQLVPPPAKESPT